MLMVLLYGDLRLVNWLWVVVVGWLMCRVGCVCVCCWMVVCCCVCFGSG